MIRKEAGGLAIQCPKCKSQSPITANNCKQCGMPFTMEGTTAEPGGGTNGAALVSLVLGIIGLFTFPLIVVAATALVFGLVGRSQSARDNGPGGQRIAIAGIALGGVGLALSAAYYLGLL